MKNRESEAQSLRKFESELERKPKGGGVFWKLVGGVMILAVAAGVVANLSDIKRYIKISSM